MREYSRNHEVWLALRKSGQECYDVVVLDCIDFVDDKCAFTPKQVGMSFMRMGSACSKYRPADWKVRMRRDSDWRQLRTMKPAAFKRFIAALTPAQRRRVAEKIGRASCRERVCQYV